jgi:hypothetical protein
LLEKEIKTNERLKKKGNSPFAAHVTDSYDRTEDLKEKKKKKLLEKESKQTKG